MRRTLVVAVLAAVASVSLSALPAAAMAAGTSSGLMVTTDGMNGPNQACRTNCPE
jgi:hypothetical protein